MFSRCASAVRGAIDNRIAMEWLVTTMMFKSVSSAGRDAPRQCPKRRAQASGAGIWGAARPDDLPRAVQGFVGLTG
jgi:hypothetical protein